MQIKNYNITHKYLQKTTYLDYIYFSFYIQKLRIYKSFININFKNYCIYTGRSRSVFRSYKMCRHQLKYFLDNTKISNIYI